MPCKRKLPRRRIALLTATCLAGSSACAQDAVRVEITGHYLNSLGSSDAASAGTITPQLIASRPLLRSGTLLELIPGMAVTQHSGKGWWEQLRQAFWPERAFGGGDVLIRLQQPGQLQVPAGADAGTADMAPRQQRVEAAVELRWRGARQLEPEQLEPHAA